MSKRKDEYWSEYYARNKTRLRTKAIAYYRAHADEIKAEHRAAWRTKSWGSLSPEKQREYQARQREKKPHYHGERRAKMKAAVVQALGGRCMVCGYSKSLAGLNVHHKPGTKTKVTDWLNPRWREFLPKLELLCGNCHQERHHPHE